MRGPAAGTALFALALLTAHNHRQSCNDAPWSTFTIKTTTSGVVASSGLAMALELDPLLAAYEGNPPTTTAEGGAAAEVSGSIAARLAGRTMWAARMLAGGLLLTAQPHMLSPAQGAQHGRGLWSLHVVWDELGRFFARFDPFGHKKPCNDAAGADKDTHAGHAHTQHDLDHARGSPGAVVADAMSLRANETDSAANTNTTDAPIVNTTRPTVNDAMLRGRRHRRRLAEPAEADLPIMVETGPSAVSIELHPNKTVIITTPKSHQSTQTPPTISGTEPSS